MTIASWAGDLSSITPLVLGTMAFVSLLIFKTQIKETITRLTNLEARRKDTVIRADLTRAADDTTDNTTKALSTDQPEDPNPSKAEHVAVEVAANEIEPQSNGSDATAIRAQMLDFFFEGNETEGNRKFEQLQSIETSPEELKLDQARRLAARFIGGIDSDALNALRELTGDAEISSFVYRMIGLCLQATKKPSEAADAFKKSVELATTAEGRVESAVYRSESLSASGKADTAIRELTSMLQSEQDSSSQLALWQGLADAYKTDEHKEQHALALHQVAERAGNDPSKWFQAGYAYGNTGLSHLSMLAIHCYSTALTFDEEHQWARNNLGAQLKENGMPILGIRSYREASKLGNTLAMANMAGALLNIGFDDEAESLLKDASSRSNPHQKVARLTSELATQRVDQNKVLAKLKEAGSRVGEFMGRYAEAQFSIPPELTKNWILTDETQVTIELTTGAITATWTTGSFQGRRRFQGTRTGRAISGLFEKEAWSPTGEDAWQADGRGYAVASASGNAIQFIKLNPTDAEYMDLTPRNAEHP